MPDYLHRFIFRASFARIFLQNPSHSIASHQMPSNNELVAFSHHYTRSHSLTHVQAHSFCNFIKDLLAWKYANYRSRISSGWHDSPYIFILYEFVARVPLSRNQVGGYVTHQTLTCRLTVCGLYEEACLGFRSASACEAAPKAIKGWFVSSECVADEINLAIYYEWPGRRR